MFTFFIIICNFQIGRCLGDCSIDVVMYSSTPQNGKFAFQGGIKIFPPTTRLHSKENYNATIQ
jgi:hypothetical protein